MRLEIRTLVNVGEDTTLGNCDVTEKLVQFLIVADGKLKMTGNDTSLLVVTGGVTSQLENFSSEVLENGSQVDGSTSTNTLGIVAFPQETVNTTDGESETGLGGPTVNQSQFSVMEKRENPKFWMKKTRQSNELAMNTTWK